MSYTYFENFKNACKNDRKNVYVWRKNVLPTADEYFKLKSENELLDFIANDGLEDLRFISKSPFKKNKNPEIEMLVYSYNFRTMCKLGYIAIMENTEKKTWILKSLHPSDDANNSIKDALEKALLLDK